MMVAMMASCHMFKILLCSQEWLTVVAVFGLHLGQRVGRSLVFLLSRSVQGVL